MGKKIKIKDYPGVYYEEAKSRKWNNRPDKVFWVKFLRFDPIKRKKVQQWERVGRLSEGVTANKAWEVRNTFLEQVRRGAYLTPEERKIAEAEEKARKERERRERELADVTLDDLSEPYFDYLVSAGKSDQIPRLRYRKHIQPVLGSTRVRELSDIHLMRLRRALAGKNLSQQSITHCFILLRAIIRHGLSSGRYAGPNVFDRLTRDRRKLFFSVNNKRQRFLTQDETRKLLDELAMVSDTVHDMALLSLHTGMRFSEIARLTWNDIEIEAGVIHVKDPKSGYDRFAYMTPQVQEMFRRRKLQMKHPVLIFPDRKGNISREPSNAYQRAVERLGLNDGVTDSRDRVVFHTLRHTFASWLAIQGTPLHVIKDLLGHRSMAMTERYAHLMPDQKREAVNGLAKAFEQATKKADVIDLASRKG